MANYPTMISANMAELGMSHTTPQWRQYFEEFASLVISKDVIIGTGSPDGVTTGYFGQSFLDTDGPTWYRCVSNPSGTSWTTLAGGGEFRVTDVAANYTILAVDYYLRATVGNITLTLPAANSVSAGKHFIVKDVGGNAGVGTPIVVAPAGADTIDTGGAVSMTNPFQAVEVVSDGVSNWERI